MRRLVFLLSTLVFLAGAAAAGDAPTAASVTEPGRSLDRALAVALAGAGDAKAKRTVLFVLDPAPALKAAGFVAAFERALQRSEAEKLAIGIGVAGAKRVVTLAPTVDRAKVLEAARAALKAPTGTYVDTLAAVRKAAGVLAKRSGTRELVLVTLENGDGETDLEATASALKRTKVRFSCISREAFLADSYWISSSRGAPRGLVFGTGDSAYLTLPWGWLWQMTLANESTPSGFGNYGVSRLAAATGGRVFLQAAPGGGHSCTYFGMCNCCAGDHLPQDEAFHSRRLRALAPSVAARKEAGTALARDAYFRLVLKAWAQASKLGLLRSRPSVRLAAGGVKPERRLLGAWANVIGGGLSLARFATKADALRKDCDKQIAWLTAELRKLDPGAGSERHRAMAEFTLAMLHVTRTNLVGCAAWCRNVGPALLGKTNHVIAPPEVESVVYRDRVLGVGYSNMCLCHGVKPFFEFRMPGGALWDEALRRLDDVYTAYMRRWAHTPYAMALRHQGLARFHFTYRGTTPPPPPRKRTGSETEKPTTENAKRPSRTGGGSTGSGSGSPTTGGG